MVAEANKSVLEEYKMPAVIVGGAILLALVLIFGVGRSMWKDLQKSSSELKAKKATFSALSMNLENLKKLDEKKSELKEKNEKLLAALPEDRDVARLFVEFENIAQQSGLTVSQAGESKASKTAPQKSIIMPIHYSISAKGSDYGSVKLALERFEDALRLLSITDMTISRSTSAFDLSFDVMTYMRGEAK